MERKNQTAVIIGRFQVPYLHLGHIYLISYALQNYPRTFILLGTAKEKDGRNPYTYIERWKVIRKVFGSPVIFQLDDVPGNDIEWSQSIDMFLDNLPEPVLLHSRDSFKDHYYGKYPLVEVPELPGYSGTELRKQIEK